LGRLRVDYTGPYRPEERQAAEIVGHSDWVSASAGADAPAAVASASGIPVYVISLPDAEERRRTITARLDAAGVPFRFADAIDGRGRSIPDRIDGARVVREAFSTEHALARTASHRLVHRMIAEGHDDIALVLEDDAKPSDNFPQALAGAAKFDFDVLKFEGGDHDSRRTAVGHAAGYTVVVRRVPSLGSAAYLIRRSAAARFCSLTVLDQTISAAFNDFRLWLRVLELEPWTGT
jgi:GR25 family glycosyltransferase involved in LPS biosynthesis